MIGSMDSAMGFLTGQLLLAMPHMMDDRFAHSVIYLCAHTPEGAMGLVVNRPLAEPSFPDLLRQLAIAPVPPAREIRLCAGGPVEHARGFVLHTTDWSTQSTLQVDERLALTANLDVLKAIASGGGPSRGLLALGYAGWGPGQLDEEMQQNSWLNAPLPDPELIFGDDQAGMWRRALALLRIDPLLLVSGPAGHA
jgi:putative transcriptional regulator